MVIRFSSRPRRRDISAGMFRSTQRLSTWRELTVEISMQENSNITYLEFSYGPVSLSSEFTRKRRKNHQRAPAELGENPPIYPLKCTRTPSTTAEPKKISFSSVLLAFNGKWRKSSSSTQSPQHLCIPVSIGSNFTYTKYLCAGGGSPGAGAKSVPKF